MMHTRKWLACLVGFGLSSASFAFTCHLDVSKECCWTPFNVTIEAVNVVTEKVAASITVPAGKSKGKVSFTCEPAQQFQLTAKYTPSIWDDDKDTVYRSMKYIALKSQIDPQDIAWSIPVVFPKMFAEVPFPADTRNCKCEEPTS